MKKNHSDRNAPKAENKTEEFVVCCGGIKPIVIPEQIEDEVTECTEQNCCEE